MLQERLRSRDFDVTGLVCSKAEADLRDKAAADSAKAKDDATNELMRAEIREVLSSAVKNLTQSDKNAAGADAAKVKSLMEALDAGITDDANATPGAAGPDARPAAGDLSRKDGPGDGAPPQGDGGAPSSAGAAPAPV
jgi:hypothetical protein